MKKLGSTGPTPRKLNGFGANAQAAATRRPFAKYFRRDHTRTQSCALVLSGLLGFLDLKPFVVVTKLETIKAQGQPSDSHTLALRNRWLEDVALTTLISEAGKAAVPGWGETAPRKADLPHEQVSPSKMTERHRASGEA
jgi:hypothetical protein